ncbi:MAG: DUF6089 family protein [Bacteroidales bacterium]|jgi:hypothetical protein|nr:DUF6089 family protein [Bacteroidales bacterium]
MVKRWILLIIVAFFGAGVLSAQVAEIGICGGVSFYMGDLNPKGVFKGSMPAGGLLFRYNISPRFAFKATALFGSIKGDDAKTGNTGRNLNFTSPLSELSAQIEINFLRLFNERGANPFTPYLFAGVGVFSFNPQTELGQKTYDLQPLGTEGQGLIDPNTGESYGKKYSLISFSIPFGFGMRVNFLKYCCIGIEWGFSKTFTDYLDDVSKNYVDRDFLFIERTELVANLADRTLNELPNGDPDFHKAGTARGNNAKTTDWYSFATVSFTIKLNYKQDCLKDKRTFSKSYKRNTVNKRKAN